MYNGIFIPLGISMLVVWGLLLPILLFIRVRNGLVKQKNEDEKLETMVKYSFVVGGFKNEYYYWEFIRSTKKIILIAIVAELVQFGVVSTSIIIIMILYVFVILNVNSDPYYNKKIQSMDNLTIYTIIVLIFLGLVYNFSQISTLEFDHETNFTIHYILLGIVAIMIGVLFVRFVWFYFFVYKGRIAKALEKAFGKFKGKKQKNEELTSIYSDSKSDEKDLGSMALLSGNEKVTEVPLKDIN